MVKISVKGNQLTITADITAGVISASGKTLVVASTNGFVPVADSELKVSLNVIRPR